MRPNLRLGLLAIAALAMGFVLGEAGDARPGAPCEPYNATGLWEECIPVPASEGALFAGRSLIVAGVGMGLFAAGRALAWRLRGRGPDGA